MLHPICLLRNRVFRCCGIDSLFLALPHPCGVHHDLQFHLDILGLRLPEVNAIRDQSSMRSATSISISASH
jgi:hypothetical protein